MKNVIHCIIKQSFSLVSVHEHLCGLREDMSFFSALFCEYSVFFLRSLKHKPSIVPPKLGRTRLGPAFQMEPFSPHTRKSTQEGQNRCPHKPSLHRLSLFLCLAVPPLEQSEGVPCGHAGRRGICICILFPICPLDGGSKAYR